jgi:hypothetical protein
MSTHVAIPRAARKTAARPAIAPAAPPAAEGPAAEGPDAARRAAARARARETAAKRKRLRDMLHTLRREAEDLLASSERTLARLARTDIA